MRTRGAKRRTPIKTYFHPDETRHHPRTYLSRGRMRQPQEIPERVARIGAAVEALGYPVVTPADHGIDPLLGVHTEPYLRFLQTAWARWKRPDWGEEVISNIFVREPNPLRGVMAEAAAYLADGSCPVGEHTWHSAYWSAQSAVAGARALVAGFEDETGRGAGAGFNLNLPMPHGSAESTFFEKLDLARRAIERWKPDVMVLALGFDIYRDDPQSLVAVTTQGFERLGRIVAGVGLPTLIVQEGGYDLESLQVNATAFFTGFGS